MRKNQKGEESLHFMQVLLKSQQNEVTEHEVYKKLSLIADSGHNRDVLKTIAGEEKSHALFWQSRTNVTVKPNAFLVALYIASARIFGFTFAVKLMEKGEKLAQINYTDLARSIPQARRIEKQEEKHEMKLLAMLDEQQLKYVGSMIMGVNDALVELCGSLAGLTFALQNTRLIALAGSITGIAASLSMGGSEYLSTKAEGQSRDPLKAGLYTGVTYMLTVVFLIAPYLFIPNVFTALAVTLAIALLIILFFAFYMYITQETPFKKHVLEMASISMGVAGLTFVLGYLMRRLFGITI